MEKPRLFGQLRHALGLRHYSIRTEQTHLQWVKRFIIFHNKQHPGEMDETEITSFLTDLAVNRRVSSLTQNQALSAISFLYREVLNVELECLDDVVRAKRPER